MAARAPVIRLNGRWRQLPAGDWLPISAGGTGADSQAGARAALDVQQLNANLTALAGLVGAANKMFYFTGASALALSDLTVFGRSLLDDADASAARSTLGLGASATYGVTSGPTGQAVGLLWRTNDLKKQSTQLDTTVGSVLVMGNSGVGPFGLGAVGATLSDVDDLNYSGLGRVTALNTPNAPTLGVGYGIGMPHAAGMTSLGGQLFLNYTTDAGNYMSAPRLFARSKSAAATWASWVEFWNTSNLVKQASRYDMTAGSVALNNAYGWGAAADNLAEANMNASDRASGLYYVNQGGAGYLPINVNSYLTHIENPVANHAMQECVPATLKRKFLREQVGGTWQEWNEYAFLTRAQTWTVKQTFNGYTQLGDTAPAIKQKKLTGTTAAAESGSTVIAHGLTGSKILSVHVHVAYSSVNTGMPPGMDAGKGVGAGYEYSWFFDATNVTIKLHPTNSENILSKGIIILITYEE
ncbi:hypothetical protein NG726_11480 [Pseudomonas sp. MOB-449]|nr:hypothetical protein [Pseudomonas sp. MOB-449]